MASYKETELTEKRSISRTFKEANVKELYKICYLKKCLSSHSIDITSLESYKAMDEVRCINNAIKHTVHISKELATNYWTGGPRVTSGCFMFLNDVAMGREYIPSGP